MKTSNRQYTHKHPYDTLRIIQYVIGHYQICVCKNIALLLLVQYCVKLHVNVRLRFVKFDISRCVSLVDVIMNSITNQLQEVVLSSVCRLKYVTLIHHAHS